MNLVLDAGTRTISNRRGEYPMRIVYADHTAMLAQDEAPRTFGCFLAPRVEAGRRDGRPDTPERVAYSMGYACYPATPRF